MGCSSTRTNRWPLVIATLALLLVALPASFVWAAPQNRNLYGQEQFTRTSGAPNTFQRTFTVPAYVSSPYTLHIINGNPDGSSRVRIEDAISAGRVLVDGVEVVGPNEFSQTVATIEKTLSLSVGAHTLEVQLASAPGSYIRLTISGVINLGNLGQARAGHTATLLRSGVVLITGGTGTGGVLSSAERFDPATLSAAALTHSLTTARTEHSATLLPQTDTLLIAGEDALGPLFSTERFRLSDETFQALSPTVQTLRAGQTATALLDGRVLITGGQSSGALSSVERFNAQTVVVFKPAYDPEQGTFTVLANGLHTGRWDHTATLLPDGRVLLTGGRDASGVLASAEIFDPLTEEFTVLANSLTTPRAGHTATLRPDGKVLLLGGENSSGTLASAEVFDPATNTFTPVSQALLVPRVNHTATLLAYGEVLITGGRTTGGTILATTEYYGPPAADTVSPVVQAVQPPSGSVGVDRTQILGVRFSEPVDVRTLTATSVTLTGGGTVSVTRSPGEQGLLLFVVPSAPLTAGTTYTLSLSAAIKDTAGNAMAAFTTSFTTVAAPTITGFTPTTGTAGTPVTITGTNFDSVASKNEVTFNGVTATVTAASTTSLTATVPSGATTGPIAVTTRGGTATSATNFTVVSAPPTITSFSPTSGHLGTLLTVTGTNFDPTPSGNQVRIGGVLVAVQSATSTQLVVLVPTGVASGLIAVTTPGGSAQSASAFTVIAMTALTVTPAQATLPVVSSQAFRGTATFSDGSTSDVTSLVSWVSSTPGSTSVTAAGVAQGVAAGTATITGSVGTFSAAGAVKVISANPGEPPLPPDPVAVAPPLNRTVGTTLVDSTAFLYTGTNPIQTGVVAGTIKTTQAAVVRGQVKGRDGFPIPGVTVTVLNHPEFGQTVTRPDGLFDLAVNGGGVLTVKYAKTGLLPVQRQVEVPWQTFAVAADAIMIPLDTQVTTVTANAATMQVAQGSVVTDAAGTRRATLFVPAGTTATMTLPGGSTQPLSTLSTRLTEYTVGPNVKQSLPATLPPGNLNQYALELSVDEAIAAGATRVTFNQPVVLYVENFLNFECGDPLPIGSYDTVRAVWIPEPTGVVIQILSVTGGLADVDTDGNGTADNTGLSIAERQQLAAQYPVGSKLWRIPTTHFSTTTSACNTKTPPGATPPNGGSPQNPDAKVNDPCLVPRASTIACENQTLGETLPLTGTPFSLSYVSDRVRGRTAANQIAVPLSGPTVPASLKRIELIITQGGRSTVQTFPPTANQQTTFIADGRDPYGRPLQGPRGTKIHLDFVYDGVHKVTGQPRGREVALGQDWELRNGGWEQQALGFGGWSLTLHHAYDPITRTLYRGDGTTVQAEALSPIVTTVAGGGNPPDGLGDGGPATQASLLSPHYLAIGPDGSLYIGDQLHHRVRKVDPNGTITTVAGNGTAGFAGDGGPATVAQLNRPLGIALGPDGSLYIGDNDNYRIRRVDPQGLITTVAGNGTAGYSGDGGPATSASLSTDTRALAVGPDGTLYITDILNLRVRRVRTDGIIETFAGNGGFFPIGDGGPATQASLAGPWGIAVGPDGSVYINDTFRYTIRKVDVNGIITTIAGTENTPGTTGDGGPATQARLLEAVGLTVRTDGTLYIGGYNHHRVRWIDAETKFITTLAGTGQGILDVGFTGDGGPAAAAQMAWPSGMSLGQDGALYATEPSYGLPGRVRRIAPPFPGLATSDLLVPSQDSSELYVFSNTGRHLRTIDALTSANRAVFGYDSAGLLITIPDADGKVTTIERDGSGNPTAIVAPGGQRTVLTVHGDGYLASLTNPAGENTLFTYSADGLLATLKDPRGGLHQYTYDASGRLINDQDPATGFKALARTEQATGWTIALSTALNRTKSYQVENLPIGDLRRKVTDPNGLLTTSVIGTNGTTSIAAPDGTVTTTVQTGDPRWGMQAPILKSLTVQTPGGLTSTLSTTRAVTLSNPNDPLSLSTQTDTLVINGRTYTSTYTQATRLLSTTTPANRTSTVTLDAKGRVIQELVTGLEPVAYTYDSLGRLSTITQGTGVDARTSTLSYNTKNELINIQDPLNRTVGFAYDLAGRITTQTLPDTRQIGYAYDANGNVTAITPPGKPAHTFAYTPVDLESDYSPPDIGFSPKNTQYTYNLDRQLTLVTRPDGQTLQLGYEPTGGRLSTLTLPGSQVLTYAYHPSTGNLSTITAPGGSTLSYSYDGSLLTNTAWSGTVAGSVGRTYDNNFRITSQSVNGANTVAFGYDNDSLLTSAGAETITRRTDNGLISATTLGSVTDSRSYSTFGELSSYAANVSGSPVFSTTYTRDQLGRITQKTETIGGMTDTLEYGYDLAGRLTQVKQNGTVIASYLYDTNGNRLSRTTSSGTTLGFYDNQDRLTQYGTTTSAYTANGELQSSTVGGQTTTYTYDVLGNLKSVVGPTGFTIEYVVDGQNRRIGKKVNGVLTQGFLYQNQLNPVAEFDGTGNIVSRFVYGTKANVPDYIVKSGVTYRIVSDHLGSPRLVINTTDGSVAQRLDYDEFGNVLVDTNPGFQPLGFAGGLSDPHTGLVRFGARDYDPLTGRWTAKDPIDFNGEASNLYIYVLGDPVNYLDQTGRSSAAATAAATGLSTSTGTSAVEAATLRAAARAAAAGIAAGATVSIAVTAIVLGLPGEVGAGSDIVPQSFEIRDTRTPNVANPDDALDSIEKAQEKLKKGGARPSVKDAESDFEGMKKRPKQCKIQSTKKSQQRAKNKRAQGLDQVDDQ